MPCLLTRRQAITAMTASLASGISLYARSEQRNSFADIERTNGGRLGVFALETQSGRCIEHRSDERFLMCSTFKMLAAAAVLSRVDAGQERLDRPVAYTRADLVEPYPVTGPSVVEGRLSVEALCKAAVEVSDSTAANLLMSSVGGPAGLTAYMRTLGDQTTHLDRYEIDANTPQGRKDTTTPRAMAVSAGKILQGGALQVQSSSLLEGWMVAAVPGLKRIRAGLPPAWPAGDRPGTGASQTNDVAIIRPPGRLPVIVAAYCEAPKLDGLEREAVLRAVGAAVAQWVVQA